MSKFFIDTEFIEGFHKPLFGKRRHFIDLISIGIYCEDGRSYYAISNEFNYKDADDWVKENVIDKIEGELFQQQNTFAKSHFNFGLKDLLKQFGKTNKQICTEIMMFIWNEAWKEWIDESDEFFERGKKNGWIVDTPIEFYGYYSDYDWVLFCSLFGRMIDLPKDFPMYCIDLKQTLDEKLMKQYPINNTSVTLLNSTLNARYVIEIRALKTLKEKLNYVKKYCPTYPKQENEHNALADAKWNYDLYKFLQTL